MANIIKRLLGIGGLEEKVEDGFKTVEEAIDYLNNHTNIHVRYKPSLKGEPRYILTNVVNKPHQLTIREDKQLISYANYEKQLFGPVK